MIGFLKGIIVEKQENYVLLDVNSVGFEISISTNTALKIGNAGESVFLNTYMQVKEDGMNLFGFYSKEEKELFTKLITVSGVGCKMAITILSSASLKDLTIAIVSEDVKFLSKCKGIGKKTAERIILELKEQFNAVLSLEDKIVSQDIFDTTSNTINDALMALMTLGMTRNDALKNIKTVYNPTLSAEQIIEGVLKTRF